MSRPRTLQLEVDGQRVSGVVEGPEDSSRPIVIYLHGFGSHAQGDKGAFFSRHFVTVGVPFCRFDLRGHGDSAGRLASATVARNLADLEAVIAELGRRGWRRYVLMGSSYGALTALVFAARQPRLVAAVVGVAAAIGIAESIRRREGDERLRAWRRAGQAAIGDGEGVLSWGFFEDARRWDPVEIAAGLRAPALLFHGLEDEEVDWAGVHAFAGRADSVQLHGFVDGDHRLLAYLPRIWEETERYLRPFLQPLAAGD